MTNPKTGSKSKKPKVATDGSKEKVERRSWAKEEEEFLLKTNSNYVAALILKRTKTSCSARRNTLVHIQGRKSVEMIRMGLKAAKKIAAQIIKEHKKEQQNNELKSTTKALPDHNIVNHQQEQKNNLQVAIRQQPVLLEEENTLVILINDQELFLKPGLKKLIIRGTDISVLVEQKIF